MDEEDFPFMDMPLSDLDICEDGWEREGGNCGRYFVIICSNHWERLSRLA